MSAVCRFLKCKQQEIGTILSKPQVVVLISFSFVDKFTLPSKECDMIKVIHTGGQSNSQKEINKKGTTTRGDTFMVVRMQE